MITGVTIDASCTLAAAQDGASIAVSTTNGLNWQDVWKSDKTGEVPAHLQLVNEVNGAYEALVKVTLLGRAQLRSIAFQSETQINTKAQPRLNVGKNYGLHRRR